MRNAPSYLKIFSSVLYGFSRFNQLAATLSCHLLQLMLQTINRLLSANIVCIFSMLLTTFATLVDQNLPQRRITEHSKPTRPEMPRNSFLPKRSQGNCKKKPPSQLYCIPQHSCTTNFLQTSLEAVTLFVRAPNAS